MTSNNIGNFPEMIMLIIMIIFLLAVSNKK